jgi:hypothetical protein
VLVGEVTGECLGPLCRTGVGDRYDQTNDRFNLDVRSRQQSAGGQE